MIKIASAQGFTTDELHKLQDAENLANQVLASQAFKSCVIGYIQTDGKTPGFTFTTDGPEGIYNTLVQDVFISVSIVTYRWLMAWRKRNEIAHEDEGGVTLNRAFWYKPVSEIAGTLVHEAAHQLGYSHPFEQGYIWENSVPEAVGNLVSVLARQDAFTLAHAQSVAPALNPNALAHAMAAEVSS